MCVKTSECIIEVVAPIARCRGDPQFMHKSSVLNGVVVHAVSACARGLAIYGLSFCLNSIFLSPSPQHFSLKIDYCSIRIRFFFVGSSVLFTFLLLRDPTDGYYTTCRQTTGAVSCMIRVIETTTIIVVDCCSLKFWF